MEKNNLIVDLRLYTRITLMQSEPKCPSKVKINLKRMLDVRKITGEDVDISDIHNCPGFLWGMRRGNSWAAVVVQTVSKDAAVAIFNYCQPPPPSSGSNGEPIIHPHSGNNIRRCVIVYKDKCTVIAGKELSTFKPTSMELFSMSEIMICPLDNQMQAQFELLGAEEAAEVRTKYPNIDQLAKIWSTEPVNRYFNAPVGSIYRTKEQWGTLQPRIVYRLVTNPSS